jgi:hypothetical protein
MGPEPIGLIPVCQVKNIQPGHQYSGGAWCAILAPCFEQLNRSVGSVRDKTINAHIEHLGHLGCVVNGPGKHLKSKFMGDIDLRSI